MSPPAASEFRAKRGNLQVPQKWDAHRRYSSYLYMHICAQKRLEFVKYIWLVNLDFLPSQWHEMGTNNPSILQCSWHQMQSGSPDLAPASNAWTQAPSWNPRDFKSCTWERTLRRWSILYHLKSFMYNLRAKETGAHGKVNLANWYANLQTEIGKPKYG